jgi:4'-phosphopantetheinyl transferase
MLNRANLRRMNVGVRTPDPWLDERHIHLWTVGLTASEEALGACSVLLSGQEAERATSFRFPQHRREFIIAHGFLRILLARYSGATPEAIEFAYGTRQKPRLKFPAADLRFNMSHTPGLAVYAFARGIDVGVDVERIHPIDDLTNLADQFFCLEEAQELKSLEAGVQERGFFLCWTRKEAYVKAVGEGLFCPLDSFRVTLDPATPARLVHLANDTQEALQFKMLDISLASDYAGALVYRGAERELVSTALETVDEVLGRLGD